MTHGRECRQAAARARPGSYIRPDGLIAHAAQIQAGPDIDRAATVEPVRDTKVHHSKSPPRSYLDGQPPTYRRFGSGQ